MPDRRDVDVYKVDETELRRAVEENLSTGAHRSLEGAARTLRVKDVRFGSEPPQVERPRAAATALFDDADVRHPAAATIVKTAVIGEYVYGILGLVLGLASIIGGVVLGLNGVAGNTSLTAKLIGFSIGVNDAVPGVILFVVGAIFIYITRPDVNLKKLR
jgi:hypothetical protein